MSKTDSRYSRDSSADSDKIFDFMYILKAVSMAYAVSAVFLLAAAVIAAFQCLSDKGIGIIVNLVTALGVALCGFLSGRRSGRGGLLSGALSGIIYTAVLCLIGNLVSQTFCFGANTITALIIGVVCGAVGGIVGINTRSKRRRY